ncbi:hypothetical protein [Bradyrhizobium tropiciagri]|uniref:hypothetical protein n=1 Tax=Bradyrhizobium tropiciagri TaxID=312253 RepID=UPI001009D8F5|nr:hypothetical protein [Bradyrhizobium tropiciagri]
MPNDGSSQACKRLGAVFGPSHTRNADASQCPSAKAGIETLPRCLSLEMGVGTYQIQCRLSLIGGPDDEINACGWRRRFPGAVWNQPERVGALDAVRYMHETDATRDQIACGIP